MAGDITRFTFHALGFFTSETIKLMDNEEIGQYVLLMCESILLGKECSLPDDLQYLARACRTSLRKLSESVVAEYPVVLTEFGPRRRNRKLYEEWLRISGKSEKARESVGNRKERPVRNNSTSSIESVTNENERLTNDSQSFNGRQSNRTEEHNTIQNRTEQSASISSAMSEFEKERSVDDVNEAGRKRGEPGYFQRGQYPGTSPKAIWKHAAMAWSRLRGDGAHCRFPTKHPQAKTDAWEDLCGTKSGDLIIPAFELWIVKHGQFIETQYPLGEFLKGNNVSEFLTQVSPLNCVRPKLTAQVIAATNELAAKRREELFSPPSAASQIEPDAEAFLETK